MGRISFKIYVVANLIIYLGFAIVFFPEGLFIGLFAVSYSFIFSSPVIILLIAVLRFLKLLHFYTSKSWITFLVCVGGVTCLPYYLFTLTGKIPDDMQFVLPLSFISGYSAVLLFSPALHYLFQTFQCQANNENY